MEPIRVVVVDDQKITVDGFAILINKRPNMEFVGEALNGDQAIDLVKRLQPDVVCIDIVMPGTDGLQAARQISANNPSVKILFVSSSLQPETAKQAFKSGACGVLKKEDAFNHLIEAIEIVASNEMYVGPNITISDRRLTLEKANMIQTDANVPPSKTTKEVEAILRHSDIGVLDVTDEAIVCDDIMAAITQALETHRCISFTKQTASCSINVECVVTNRAPKDLFQKLQGWLRSLAVEFEGAGKPQAISDAADQATG